MQKELADKINTAQLNGCKYFIDGTYRITETGFEIKPMMKNSKNGKVVQEETFAGANLFVLFDSISIYLRQSLGLTPAQMEESIDLNFSDYFTDNLKAFSYLAKGMENRDLQSFEKAIELDTTFAAALGVYASTLYLNYRAKESVEVKSLMEKAMRYRKKLPANIQNDLLVVYYLINDETEKAEQIINLQLEENPEDPVFLRSLFFLYKITGDINKLNTIVEKLSNGSPNPNLYIEAIHGALMSGKATQVEKDVLVLLEQFPDNYRLLDMLMDAYILQQKYDQAQATLEKMILLNPDLEATRSIMGTAIQYMKENSFPTEMMEKLSGRYKNDGQSEITSLEVADQFIITSCPLCISHYTYPVSDTSIGRGFSTFYNVNIPLEDDAGKVYGYLLKQKNNQGQEGSAYFWKLDSLILRAEALLRDRNYQDALPAYEAAIAANPEHYYLYKAKEHVAFMLSKTDEEIEQIYLRYVGQYDKGQRIWIEDGYLNFKNPDRPSIILRPIAEDAFIDLIDYNGIYSFEQENGEVRGIFGQVYDKKLKKWYRLEGWYQTRIKPKG